MSGDVSKRKRLIAVTGGNLRNDHIYFSGHYEFFPKECFGESSKKKGTGKPLKLFVAGLDTPIETDISKNGSNGSPRSFFRKRTWVHEFFKKHEIQEGDVLAIERLKRFEYRVYPFESKNVRDGAAIPGHWPEISRNKLTVIDLNGVVG